MPTTWHGWAAIFVAVILMVLVSVYLRLYFRNSWGLVAMLAFDAVALGALALVSRRKTEGEWRWRWGD